MCSIFYYFFKYTWSELDIPVADDIYYEFTKSTEWHLKRSLEKQVEPNLNIPENENQRLLTPVTVSRRCSKTSVPQMLPECCEKCCKKILRSKVKMNSSRFSMVFFMELAEMQV